LSRIKEIAYCGLSVSGNGYWGLVPIEDPKHHLNHFKALLITFQKIGIAIDKSCNDVCRLRGYSIDIDGYFNHNASIFKLRTKARVATKKVFNNYIIAGHEYTKNKVESYINLIHQKKIDLTTNYEDWFQLGCSFANEFGENGRDYFHSISSCNSKYNHKETDRQFNQCLRNKYSYGIGTFFYLCRTHGVEF